MSGRFENDGPSNSPDHDDFGLNQSKIINVIDSKSLERDADEKPLSIFPHSPRKVPVTDVMSRAGHELAHLARLLDHLQILIAPLIQEAARRDPHFLRQMQNFDHIGQKVTGLADFLAALALAVPCEWLVDPATAARTVMLADLSSRLAFTDDTKDSCSTAWGDCEIF